MKLTRPLLSPAGNENDNTAGGGSGVGGREPGSVDNRLSLNPSDPKWAEKIDSWADGESYTVTAKVTQISPGEFEVEEVTDAKPYTDDGGDEESDETQPDSEVASTDGNPAMKKLMGE